MAQLEMELILARQLASHLAIPLLLVDANGDTLFFNDAAEHLLGLRFDEIEVMSLEDRARTFSFKDERGRPIPIDSLPLAIALRERRPCHATLRALGLDGIPRLIESTAFPLEGSRGHLIGGIAMFWETEGA